MPSLNDWILGFYQALLFSNIGIVAWLCYAAGHYARREGLGLALICVGSLSLDLLSDVWRVGYWSIWRELETAAGEGSAQAHVLSSAMTVSWPVLLFTLGIASSSVGYLLFFTYPRHRWRVAAWWMVGLVGVAGAGAAAHSSGLGTLARAFVRGVLLP